MDNLQLKMHIETDYQSRMTNVKLFARAIRLNNLILDASNDNIFKNVLELIRILQSFKIRILENQVPVTQFIQSEVDMELNSKYLLLLRTAILFSAKKTSDSSNNEEVRYNLNNLVKYLSSMEFSEKIGKDKEMNMRLTTYNILINANRRESSVRDAFLNIDRSLREFNALTLGLARGGMKTDNRSANLRNAIVALLRACLTYTEDIDYIFKVCYKFGFQTIYDCMCDDLVEGKFAEMKMNKFLQNYIFSVIM